MTNDLISFSFSNSNKLVLPEKACIVGKETSDFGWLPRKFNIRKSKGI